MQEEYNLASNLDQMVSRMDSFDEFRHLRDRATDCHQNNPSLFAALVNEGLVASKQKEYLKRILQSQRVLLEDQHVEGQKSTTYSASQELENVPRRIVRVKRQNAPAADLQQL